jgi:hypothetical protein
MRFHRFIALLATPSMAAIVTLETDNTRIGFDSARHGGIVSLVDKATGRNFASMKPTAPLLYGGDKGHVNSRCELVDQGPTVKYPQTTDQLSIAKWLLSSRFLRQSTIWTINRSLIPRVRMNLLL